MKPLTPRDHLRIAAFMALIVVLVAAPRSSLGAAAFAFAILCCLLGMLLR